MEEENDNRTRKGCLIHFDGGIGKQNYVSSLNCENQNETGI